MSEELSDEETAKFWWRKSGEQDKENAALKATNSSLEARYKALCLEQLQLKSEVPLYRITTLFGIPTSHYTKFLDRIYAQSMDSGEWVLKKLAEAQAALSATQEQHCKLVAGYKVLESKLSLLTAPVGDEELEEALSCPYCANGDGGLGSKRHFAILEKAYRQSEARRVELEASIAAPKPMTKKEFDLQEKVDRLEYNIGDLNSMNADYAKRERESLDRAEKAEQRVAELESSLLYEKEVVQNLFKVKKESEAALAECQEALDRYSKCETDCKARTGEWEDCSCGLRAALEAPQPGEAKPETRQPCTCTGTCRGKEGLGNNWYCVSPSPANKCDGEGGEVKP